MKSQKILFYSMLLLLITACMENKPNENEAGEDRLEQHEVEHSIDNSKMQYDEVIYVPIYSDIYVDSEHPKCLLSATLSIRNTSIVDTLFVTEISYYNTEGTLVKEYLKNPIAVPPMGTVNYVIERDDDIGGSGANFIVKVSAENPKIRPVIQAVMIGEYSNKAFSFTAEGYAIPR